MTFKDNRFHIIITGATSWMSRATAVKLLEQNYKVVLCGRSFDKVDGVVDSLTSPGRVFAGVADVTDAASIQAIFQKTLDNHGRIDAVINVAGGVATQALPRKQPIDKNFIDTSIEEFDATINLNFYGVVNTTRIVLPHMIERKQGNIINIVSNLANTGFPKFSAYASSKAAVISFSKSLAKEVGGDNVRINCIIPGPTKSRYKPTGTSKSGNVAVLGPTSPHDVADAVSFLISNQAKHITGTVLDISGGQ